MDVHLNRQVSSEPCISPDGDPSLPDLEEKNAYSYQPSWTESIFGDSSTTITNNISKKTSLQLSEDNEPPQDTEEALIESLAFYNPNPSLDDLTHASMLSMAGRNTMFSSMRTVPLDMKIIKEDLAYYQYKLYQRFSVKLADLVRLETLGKGAFGEVTRVFNKTDRLFYALKEIKMENFKKRNYYEGAVWTEIRNLLKLNELDDPLVMKTILIDFNEDEDTCYLVMELGGGTLEEYVECMRYYGLTWKEEDLEYIMYQLVSQILKLKQVGMYHRDIKPSNVVISCKQESFKLGDFGCSCITKPGVQKLDIAGTPHYMSPELVYAILKREQIVEHDPYLSDLFSLGITMLTLIEPDLKRKDVGEFLESVVKERYPELYIILKDLLGHPSQRDEGVHKFLAKKLKVKTYPEFKAGNLGERYKLYLYLKVISKNKHIDTSLYFDMCILDDALLVIKKKIDLLTISRNPEEHNLEEVIWRIRLARCYYMQMNYESAYKELQDIMQRKELMNFEPQFALTKAKALLWMGIVKEKLGKRSSSIEDLMQCLGIRVAELDDVHEDVSEVYWYLGDMRTRQENFPGAIRAFQKCIEIGEKLEPKQRKYIAKGLLSLGLLAELRGDHEKALELFERARKIAIEAYGEHHPGVADPLLGIGYEKIILGSSDEGLDLYEEALATKIRWYGESNPEVADTYTKIAQGYDHMGEYKKALNVLGKSAVIWKKVKGEESQELADVYQLIGSVMCKKGNYLKSLEYASKVISNKEKNLGVNHPCLAGIYVWHAETCSALGLESLKQKSLESFLTIDFDRMELNRDNIKIGFRAVGLLAEDGRIDRAWEYAEKAYQMCVNLAVAKTSDTYACYCEAMGKLKLAEGKYKEALEHVKEALRIRDCLPCKDPDIETGLHNLMGDLYESMEDSRETLRWRRRSIELIERYLSKHGLLMLKALINLSRALQKVGKNGEAREKLNVAGELIEKLRVTRCHPLFNKWLDVQNSLEGRQNTIQK